MGSQMPIASVGILIRRSGANQEPPSSSELMTSGILPGTSASVHDGKMTISAK